MNYQNYNPRAALLAEAKALLEQAAKAAMADGSLPEESHNGDGIHLNGDTFEVVMEYIRTHAYN